MQSRAGGLWARGRGPELQDGRGRGCCCSLHACLTAAHLKTILEVFISLPLLSAGETSLRWDEEWAVWPAVCESPELFAS